MAGALQELELSSFLVPPEPGDELALLLLTTFGLDLATLGALLASKSIEELENSGIGETTDLADLLPFTPFAARRASSGETELLVLADAGGIQSSLPAGSDGLARFLSRFVVSVRANATGRYRSYFHPKLAIAGFRAPGRRERVRWRVLIGSKNLTRGAAFELGMWLESADPGVGASGLTGKDLLKAIDSWKVRTRSRVEHQQHVRFMRRLRKAGFEKARFPIDERAQRLVKGMRVQLGFELERGADRALVATPFLNPGSLPRVAEKADAALISNSFSSEDLETLRHAGWSAWRWRGGSWAHNLAEAKLFPTTLHAKMALWKSGGQWRLYLGSGNATAGGARRNRELGIVLELVPSLAENLLSELLKEAQPFVASDDGVASEVDESEQIKRGLADAASGIEVERLKGSLRLTLEPGDDLRTALAAGAKLRLRIDAASSPIDWDPGKEAVKEIDLPDGKPGLLVMEVVDAHCAESVLVPYVGEEKNVEELREATLPTELTQTWEEARWKERILGLRGVTRPKEKRRQKRRRRTAEVKTWNRHITIEDVIRAAVTAPDRARALIDPRHIRSVVFDNRDPPARLIEAIRKLAGEA